MTRELGLIALLSLVSCRNTESFQVRFQAPGDPNPFTGVDQLQVWGVLGDGVQDLGRHRWDQGRFTLPLAPVEVQRLVFAGLAFGPGARVDAVLAAGRTRALDVLQSPPSSALRVDFWASGRLSRLEDLPWTGPSWLASLGEAVLVAEQVEGCAPVPTLLWDGDLGPGPVLPAGFGAGPRTARVGARTLLVGRSGCGGPDWGMLGPTGELEQAYVADVPLRADATLVVASERRVLLAGGVEATGLGSVEVFELDPSTGDSQLLGRLDRPRVGAAGAVLTQDLVAFAGGRSRTSTSSVLSNVSFFSLGAGRSQGLGIELGGPRLTPALRRLASGSLLVVGGREGAAAIVPELEPTRTATLAPTLGRAGGGEGDLVDLEDGSLLWVERGGRVQWLQLLPERVVEVESRTAGPWRAASAGTGRALLVDGGGRLWGFDAGPQGLLAATPSLELLGPDVPLGLVPLRPGAWQASAAGVVGRAPSAFSVQLLPSERLLLAAEARLDFELTLGLELGPQARASVVFGQVQEDFDHVVLSSTPQVVRGPRRRSSAPLNCPPVRNDALGAEGQPTLLRVARRNRGREVVLDVGADGRENLRCDTPSPRAGGMSLAVINGEVRFFGARLR
jgi:hypothetical protein